MAENIDALKLKEKNMKKRQIITIDQLFINKNNKNGIVLITDTLEFLYRRPKSHIVLLEKSLNELSKQDIEISSRYVNTNTFFTQIDVEILNVTNGFKTDLQIPYINGIESLLDLQPNFQLFDILIYLKDIINWGLIEHKLSKYTVDSVNNSIEAEYQHDLQLMYIDQYTSNELNEEFLNEILRDEYYGNQYRYEEFQIENRQEECIPL